jgi:hypothetical protein
MAEENKLHPTRWRELAGDFFAREHLVKAKEALEAAELITHTAGGALRHITEALAKLHPVVHTAEGQAEFRSKLTAESKAKLAEKPTE